MLVSKTEKARAQDGTVINLSSLKDSAKRINETIDSIIVILILLGRIVAAIIADVKLFIL